MRLVIPALLALASPAAAAPIVCAPADVVFANLAARFDETLDAIGIEDGQTTYQWWADREDGSWTLLRVTSDGVACMIAAGFAYSADRTPAGAKM